MKSGIGRKHIFNCCFAILVLLVSCNTSIHEYLRSPVPKTKSAKLQSAMKGNEGPFRSCFDVTHYDLSLDVNIPNRYLRGEVKVGFTQLKISDTLQLDLYSNMKVNVVTLGNIPLQFIHLKNRLLIAGTLFQPGKKYQLTVRFEGKPIASIKPPWVGGFVWRHDLDGYPLIGVVSEGLGGSFWWPCKDHPSDEPDSMSIHISVPSDLVAVSNGKLEGKEFIDGSNSRWNWKVRNPISSLGVTLNIGHYSEMQDTVQFPDGSVVELSHYVLPRNYEKAKKHFAQAREIIRFYSNLFGEYPWMDDGYKLVEAPYIGMEHQSAIAYGNGFSNTNNYFTFGLADYIILHETAHEWWGNSLTACDGSEVWLHEGFATYCEALYIESKTNSATMQTYLEKKRAQIKNKAPIVGPSNINYFAWRDNDVYSKGCWVLHTLRHSIGNDSLFFSLLKTFANRYQKSIICSDDFIETVREITGQDYQYFFLQYLYEAKEPVLEYFYDENRIYYRWTEVSGDFRMPAQFKIGAQIVRVYPSIITNSTKVSDITRVFPDAKNFLIKTRWAPELKKQSDFLVEKKKTNPIRLLRPDKFNQ